MLPALHRRLVTTALVVTTLGCLAPVTAQASDSTPRLSTKKPATNVVTVTTNGRKVG